MTPRANYLKANLFLGLSSVTSMALALVPALLHYAGCENWLGPAFSKALALGAEGALPDRAWFRFLQMLDNPAALLILAFLAMSAVLLYGPKLAKEYAPVPVKGDVKELAGWLVHQINSLFQAFAKLYKDSLTLSACVCIWRVCVRIGFFWFFVRMIIYNQYHTPGALIQMLCGGLALFALVLCGLASLKAIKTADEEAKRRGSRF